MARWDGMDANRVTQGGLINSLPRLRAVPRHRPLPILAALVQTGSRSRDRRPLPKGTNSQG